MGCVYKIKNAERRLCIFYFVVCNTLIRYSETVKAFMSFIGEYCFFCAASYGSGTPSLHCNVRVGFWFYQLFSRLFLPPIT